MAPNENQPGTAEIAIDAADDVPRWLDRAFLEHAYGSHLQRAVRIETLAIEPAVAKGENYGSALYRIRSTYVDGGKETTNDAAVRLDCIVKAPYDEGFGRTLLDRMNVYAKELIMYETLLPEMRAMLRANGLSDDLVPETIFVCHRTKSIVFEDLSLQGFRMAARGDGLDVWHARGLLRQLAVFHACGAVLHERQPDVFERYFRHGMLNRNDRSFENFYLTSLDALRELVAGWPGFERYAGKLDALRPHLLERGRLAFDAKPGHFHTLIHGDIWLNNVMYTYRPRSPDDDVDDDAVDDVVSDDPGAMRNAPGKRPDRTMLVDFQFCCWASPTIDLHYFLNTSLREPLRQPHRQEQLLQFYHGVLTETLRALGFGGFVPTLHEFHAEFMQNSCYAFISACLVQPIMLNEETADADIAALHDCDERALRFKRTVFANRKVHGIVRSLLPVFDRRGLLDV